MYIQKVINESYCNFQHKIEKIEALHELYSNLEMGYCAVWFRCLCFGQNAMSIKGVYKKSNRVQYCICDINDRKEKQA